MIFTGERQVSSNLEGIRRDHTERYFWTVKKLGPVKQFVLDAACGIGYGSCILADAGHDVLAIDKDWQTLEYASKHWARKNITYLCADLETLSDFDWKFDALVSFETIEHLENPKKFLSKIDVDVIYASVPNQKALPFTKDGFPFHHRHYTSDELSDLVHPYVITEVLGQMTRMSAVTPLSDFETCRTIVFEAKSLQNIG